MIIHAIIPARSGSKGLPDKNIKPLGGFPLISYSIMFAKKLGCDRIICSTDSDYYADIAKSYGAEVPFLRSEKASKDDAMEHDILRDLAISYQKYKIEIPDIIVWLRPTFVFRDVDAVKKCISALKENTKWTSARTVCETEARLYKISQDGNLVPNFDDKGLSMIRRQDIGAHYKVFSADIIRFNKDKIDEDFLGRNIFAVPVNKLCGLDIDDQIDFSIIEAIINGNRSIVSDYIFTKND